MSDSKTLTQRAVDSRKTIDGALPAGITVKPLFFFLLVVGALSLFWLINMTQAVGDSANSEDSSGNSSYQSTEWTVVGLVAIVWIIVFIAFIGL